MFCMETSPIWKQPVFFEDSPICPKKKCCACDPDSDCVLMGFVPIESRHDALPCHHIPLNETGETIDSLHKTGRTEEIETALRSRLVNTIERLDSPIKLFLGTNRPHKERTQRGGSARGASLIDGKAA